ncbi:MAG: energy transducer TonB, partial [Chromatiaceae bacterium]
MTSPDAGSILPLVATTARSGTSDRNLALALLASLLAHVCLVLFVSVEMPGSRSGPAPDEALEILVLRDHGIATDDPAPDSALSQRSRLGESNQGDAAITVPDAEDSSPTEPLQPLASEERIPPEEVASQPGPQQLEQAPDGALTQLQPPTDAAEAPEPDREPEPTPDPEVLAAEATPAEALEAPPPPVVDATQILGSRDREIARLTASLEAQTTAYANRQRRKSVSASTREFRYASYLGAWARKVERIGNLNYPQAAKEQHIYGSLILHVAVRRDGSVEAIRIVRSSG